MPNLRELVWRSIKGFVDDRCGQKAAAISYYVLFSIFPLVILTVSIINIVSPHSGLRDSVVQTILDNVPLSQHDNNDVAGALHDASGQQGDAFGLIGAVGLLWAASSVFGALRTAFNDVFEVQTEPSVLLRKGFDLLIVLAFTPFFFASFGITAALRYAADTNVDIPLIGDIARGDSIIWAPVRLAVPFALSFIAILTLYWYVPGEKQPVKNLAPAAVIAAAFFELSKHAFGAYLSHANYTLVFGPLGAIVAFLFWIYFCTNILLLGAEIAAALPAARMGRPARPPGYEAPPLWLAAARGARDLLLKPGTPGRRIVIRKDASGDTRHLQGESHSEIPPTSEN